MLAQHQNTALQVNPNKVNDLIKLLNLFSINFLNFLFFVIIILILFYLSYIYFLTSLTLFSLTNLLYCLALPKIKLLIIYLFTSLSYLIILACLIKISFMYIFKTILNIVCFHIYKKILIPFYSFLTLSNTLRTLFNCLFLLLLFIFIFLILDYLNLSVFKVIYCDPESLREPIVVKCTTNNKIIMASGSFVDFLYYKFGAKFAFITVAKTAGYIMREMDSDALPTTSNVSARDEIPTERGLFTSNSSDLNNIANPGFEVAYSATKLAPQKDLLSGAFDLVLIKMPSNSDLTKNNFPKIPNNNNKTFKFTEVPYDTNGVTVRNLMHNAFNEGTGNQKPLNSIYELHKQFFTDAKLSPRWYYKKDEISKYPVLSAIIDQGLNNF